MAGRLVTVTALALLLLLPACRAPTPTHPPRPSVELELVESVPVETSLDQPDVRDTQQVWLELINSARSSLEVAQFYLANKPGAAMEPVVQAIEAAGRRGVRVRVLVEKKFLRISRDTVQRLRNKPGVAVAVYDLSALTGGINHAKYFIVDRSQVFVGSQNMDWRALQHIHELGLRVRSPRIARDLGRIFEADWRIATATAPAQAAPAPASQPAPLRPPMIQLVASPPALNPPGIPAAADRLQQLLDGARRSIVVQLLSYSTKTYKGGAYTRIDQALRRAAARGVKVRLNLSHWSKRKKPLAALKALARVPNVTVKLNTIPPWSGGFIPHARVSHAKYMVLDGDIGWVGTSNWSGDYFTASRNVELVLRHPQVVRQLVRIFEQGWSGPYVETLDPDQQYQAPRVR